MLPDEALQEFNSIYFEEFGIELGEAEARELATGLIGLFELFAKSKTERK